jgi:HSP20 family molecular chaperone IbpA
MAANLINSIMQGSDMSNNVTGYLTEYLQSQGVDMNEIWSPAVDIIEDVTTITVYVNIPGVKIDSIDVDFFNNRIEVKGERLRSYSNTDNIIISKNEIIYGAFERKIILPISVTSRESVSIHAENGVLIIKVDKAREEQNSFSLRINNTGDNTSGGAEVNIG